MPAHPFYTNFTAGAVTEKVSARTDFAKYQNAARCVQNGVVQPQGGVATRAGTAFLGNVRDPEGRVRLVRFEFSTTQAYILEFGHLYVRPWANRAPVRLASSTPAIDLTLSAVTGAAVTITASAPLFTDTPTDRDREIFVTAGGGRLRITSVTSDTLATGYVLVDFAGTTVGSGTYTFTGAHVTVVTPYTTAQLRELRFEQSADVLYIGHTSHPPHKLSRITATTFTLGPITFLPPPSFERDVAPPADLTLSSASPGPGVTATTTAAVFFRGDVGRQIASGGGRAVITAVSGAPAGPSASITVTILDAFPSVGPFAAGTWTMDGSANNGTLTVSPTVTGPRFALVTLTAGEAGFRSSDVGKFVVFNGGTAQITAITSSTVVTAQIVRVLTGTDAAASGTWFVESPSWAVDLGFPGVPALHNQRLYWSGSLGFPDFVWGSVVGDYENHARGSVDDDAVVFQLSTSGVNVVRWMKGSTSGLALGTLASEITLDGGTESPITPSNVRSRERTFYGSDYGVDARRVDNQIVFLQRGASRIREFVFSLEADTYVAPDISILGEHLFRTSIVEMVYSRSPESLLFCLRDDGLLNVLTYERQEQVVGWSQTEIAGPGMQVESIDTIPNFCATGDEVWIAVLRDTGSGPRRTIELFDGRLNTDAALVYSGTAARTFIGFPHLDGMTARVVIADGTEFNMLVADGRITLPGTESTTAVEIGLPFVMTLQTVRPELSMPTGTIQGRRKRWNALTVRVFCTSGAPTLNGEPMDYPEQAATPFTGDMKLKTEFGWDRDGFITIQRVDAKPLTVLGITGSLTVADD
jgi:hypothetical protein